MEDRVGREGAVGCGGRGNLRENREDPAPTVGVCGDFIALRIATQMSPMAATMRIPCPPRMPPIYGTLWFLQRRGTPRRYGLRIIASA